MYAVIADHEGSLWWYGPYESKEDAEELATQLKGGVVVLYNPFYRTNTGEYYGRERLH